MAFRPYCAGMHAPSLWWKLLSIHHMHLSKLLQSYAWWRQQMETFPRYCPFVRVIHRSPVNFPHKYQWREALTIVFICTWSIDLVNNRDAGDLRRHLAHYEVTELNWLVNHVFGNRRFLSFCTREIAKNLETHLPLWRTNQSVGDIFIVAFSSSGPFY